MTRLEWFDQGYGQTALELGIISTSMFARYIQFRVYQDFLAQGKDHMEAIELTAARQKCSVTTIWKSVYFFVKPSSHKGV